MNAIATFCAKIAVRQPFNAAAGTRNHSPDANSSPATHVCGAFFLSFRTYIYCKAMGPHFCARSSFNQHRNERGCVGTGAPKGDDYDKDFKGSPEEASRCTLQAGSARVRRSKGCDRI